MALGKNNQVVHHPGPLKQSNKPHKGGKNKDKKSKGTGYLFICLFFSIYKFITSVYR